MNVAPDAAVAVDATAVVSAPTREEILALARAWLAADPELPYARAKKAAKNFKIRLTSRLFAEARRELGITAGPPRVAARKEVSPARENAPMSPAEKPKTPLMSFVLEYLRGRPTAAYADLKAAAEAKGFKIAPIVYGRARKELGLASPRAAKAPRAATPAPISAAAPRRGRPPLSGSLGGDLSGVLGRLQEMAADRDRFHDALQQIARVLRDVL